VVVVDKGELVSQGPLDELLGEGATLVVVDEGQRAMDALTAAGFESQFDNDGLVVDSVDGSGIVRALSGVGIYPSEVRSTRSSLESVFLGITGEGSV